MPLVNSSFKRKEWERKEGMLLEELIFVKEINWCMELVNCLQMNPLI